MAISEDKLRVQSVIDKKLADKINELAERMECSQSKLIYMLLEAVVADEGWMIKLMTTQFGKSVAKRLGILGRNAEKYRSMPEPEELEALEC